MNLIYSVYHSFIFLFQKEAQLSQSVWFRSYLGGSGAPRIPSFCMTCTSCSRTPTLCMTFKNFSLQCIAQLFWKIHKTGRSNHQCSSKAVCLNLNILLHANPLLRIFRHKQFTTKLLNLTIKPGICINTPADKRKIASNMNACTTGFVGVHIKVLAQCQRHCQKLQWVPQ